MIRLLWPYIQCDVSDALHLIIRQVRYHPSAVWVVFIRSKSDSSSQISTSVLSKSVAITRNLSVQSSSLITVVDTDAIYLSKCMCICLSQSYRSSNLYVPPHYIYPHKPCGAASDLIYSVSLQNSAEIIFTHQFNPRKISSHSSISVFLFHRWDKKCLIMSMRWAAFYISLLIFPSTSHISPYCIIFALSPMYVWHLWSVSVINLLVKQNSQPKNLCVYSIVPLPPNFIQLRAWGSGNDLIVATRWNKTRVANGGAV